jgi:hypothetical protein
MVCERASCSVSTIMTFKTSRFRQQPRKKHDFSNSRAVDEKNKFTPPMFGRIIVLSQRDTSLISLARQFNHYDVIVLGFIR